MFFSHETLDAELLSLPVEEQARLAELLIRSLDEINGPVDEAEVQQLWIKEADRRFQEIVNGEVEIVPAEDVMREVRA